VSQDPIGFEAGDANTYRYVGNRSTTSLDPTGLFDSTTEYYVTDFFGGYFEFLFGGRVPTAASNARHVNRCGRPKEIVPPHGGPGGFVGGVGAALTGGLLPGEENPSNLSQQGSQANFDYH